MTIVATKGSSKIGLKGINFANSTNFKIYCLMSGKTLLIISSLGYKWSIWMKMKNTFISSIFYGIQKEVKI
jgi:hypothetical protein